MMTRQRNLDMLLTPEKIGPAPRLGGFRLDGYWVWCPSLVRAPDGIYHLFASRWRKSLPMHPGWLLESEVIRAVSDRAEGPYSFAEVILPERGAAWWDGRMTHNPRIQIHDNKYYLFYTGSTHPFPDVAENETVDLNDPRVVIARANKRVGVAVAECPDGPWRRMDEPLLKTRPNFFDSFLTSNPAPFIHQDGGVTLIYKSRPYLGKEVRYGNGPMEIGVAKAPSVFGPYTRFGEPIFGPGRFAEIEDPFLWMEGGEYHLLAKDMGASLTGEYHAGAHFVSPDALSWKLHPSPKIYSRNIRWDDGERQTLGSLERASIYFEDGKPRLLWGAVADGPGGFSQASSTWDLAFPILQDS